MCVQAGSCHYHEGSSQIQDGCPAEKPQFHITPSQPQCCKLNGTLHQLLQGLAILSSQEITNATGPEFCCDPRPGEQYGCIGFSAAQRTSAERCQQFGSHCLTQGQAKITVAPTCTFDVAVELFPCHQIAFGVHSIHFVQLESWSLIPTHELHWILFATPLSLPLNSAFHSMSNSFFATDCSIGFYVQLFLCHWVAALDFMCKSFLGLWIALGFYRGDLTIKSSLQHGSGLM